MWGLRQDKSADAYGSEVSIETSEQATIHLADSCEVRPSEDTGLDREPARASTMAESHVDKLQDVTAGGLVGHFKMLGDAHDRDCSELVLANSGGRARGAVGCHPPHGRKHKKGRQIPVERLDHAGEQMDQILRRSSESAVIG